MHDDACALLYEKKERLAVVLFYDLRSDHGNRNAGCLWVRSAAKGKVVLEHRGNDGPLLSLGVLVAACVFVVVGSREDKERASRMFAKVDVEVVITSFDVSLEGNNGDKLSTCVAELQPRMIDGSFINGPILAGLLTGYTTIFNEVGGVKYLSSALVQAVERECQTVCRQCVEVCILPFLGLML
jgi:hypothetical protein